MHKHGFKLNFILFHVDSILHLFKFSSGILKYTKIIASFTSACHLKATASSAGKESGVQPLVKRWFSAVRSSEAFSDSSLSINETSWGTCCVWGEFQLVFIASRTVTTCEEVAHNAGRRWSGFSYLVPCEHLVKFSMFQWQRVRILHTQTYTQCISHLHMPIRAEPAGVNLRWRGAGVLSHHCQTSTGVLILLVSFSLGVRLQH